MNLELDNSATAGASEADLEQRESIRSEIYIVARVRQRNEEYFNAKLLNISALGFKMNCQCGYEVGDEFYLYLPEFSTLEAEIVWIDGNNLGCRFSNPIHVAVYEHIAAKYPYIAVQ